MEPNLKLLLVSVFGSGDGKSCKLVFFITTLMVWVDIRVRNVTTVQQVA